MLRKGQFILCLIISALIFAADQLSKKWIIATYMLNKPVIIISHLNFILAHNKGAAFGLLAESGGWQRWLFIIIAIVISALILVWSRRLNKQDYLEGIALACILGGALGNLADRIYYGHVIDFIDFYIGTWHWYTFNVADITICVGAFLLACVGFKKSR